MSRVRFAHGLFPSSFALPSSSKTTLRFCLPLYTSTATLLPLPPLLPPPWRLWGWAKAKRWNRWLILSHHAVDEGAAAEDRVTSTPALLV